MSTTEHSTSPTAPTTELNGLNINSSSSSSSPPPPSASIKTEPKEVLERPNSASSGDRSGETTPRGGAAAGEGGEVDGGVTPQAIPQQQQASTTVLARDMVHGSPASPQIISPSSSASSSAQTTSASTSTSTSTSTPTPPGGSMTSTPAPASGSSTASPASRLSQARPAPGIGGLAARGGRTGLGGGLSAGGPGVGGGSKLPPSLQAKIDAMATRSKPGAPGPGGADSNSLLASAASRATAGGAIGGGGGGVGGMRPGGAPLLGGLAARRAASGAGAGGPSLSGAGGGGGLGGRPGAPSLARPGAPPTLPSTGLGGGPGRRLNRPGLTLASMGGGAGPSGGNKNNSPFGNFSKIVDPSGKLNFDKKAILHAEGVNFSNGQSFEINKDQMELGDVLGKGNYGEVRKVYHKPTKVTMAMKEIRLELDQSKINGIIMELDILHRAIAPEVIEFYGAFMVESCVYYCIEYMDAGSLDALNFNGIPEHELARITKATVKGLKFLKDELQVMHRDVKPTNLLANKKGQIKLCDFGVSGQLEKSLAKTNIGCQSYMAPERIKGESTGQVSTYTVSSDVWSVGLTIIELAMGCYPYPPETYQNVFAQLQAIVHGPPPKLPDQYSATAQDFVASCLLKQPEARPTYAQLLEHPWMKEDDERDVDMAAWVASALAAKAARRSHGAPVSSSAPEVNEGHATGPAVAPPAQTANAQRPENP